MELKSKLLSVGLSFIFGVLSGGSGISNNREIIEPNCGTKEALSTCLEPNEALLVPEENNGQSAYVAESVRYFLSMKSDQSKDARIAVESDQLFEDYLRPLIRGEWNPLNKWFRKETIHPQYGPRVVRFEFPPWLLTTGYGVVTMRNVDELLRAYKTDYKSIDCRFFDQQPFARCHVVFLYGKDDPATAEDDRTECPIYEEFTFNGQGETTFIEAWTDHEGYLPMQAGDFWAEGENVKRLSTSVPGLGYATGRIEPKSDAMKRAAEIFDEAFEADYWSDENHRIGPFSSMLEDITGTVNGRWVPGGNILSFWPNWLKRTAHHMGTNILDGCRPPMESSH